MNATVTNLPVPTNTTLAKTQMKMAVRAIEDLHLAYYEKGGLRDQINAVRRSTDGVSAHIYKLATYAARTAPTLDEAVELFREMTRYAESEYKKLHKVDNLKEALPIWAVFKSNIVGAMRDGLSPLGYKSEHALRDARAAVHAAEEDEPRRLAAPAERADIDEIEEWLDDHTGVPDTLRDPLGLTILSIEHVKRTRVEDAARVLAEANERLAALADKRKLGAAAAAS